MSWFSSWWVNWLKRGFSFRVTRPWPGEKDLPMPPVWPKSVTKESVEKEIRGSLKKGAG
jgi:hypothetical protein